MEVVKDANDNVWHSQEKKKRRLNYGVRGLHASITFQCERCWFLNLEGRLPLPGNGKDAAYAMMIRRTSLDACGGRAALTITGHVDSIMRTVKLCELIGKTPPIPPWGPFPMKDKFGMGVGVEMNLKGVTGKGRLARFIQWDACANLGPHFCSATVPCR